MIKYINPREPKICSQCKLDLFKAHGKPNGYICGGCGQQYELKQERK